MGHSSGSVQARHASASFPVPMWQWIVAAAIFVAGLALNNTIYLPIYDEINYLDEIVYLSAGKHLLDGTWWPYSRGPLIAFVYAAIYPFADLFSNWLLASAVIGRFLSYALFFLAAWLIGRELQFRRLSHPLVMVGALTVLPPYLTVVTNPSYALFIAAAGLSFWAVLLYARTQSRRALIMASGFMACALLVRPDILMGAIFVLVMLINTRGWKFRPSPVNNFLAVTAVIALLSIGYIVIAGPFKFGGNMKMYNTFEAAQQILVDTKGMFDFDAAAKGKEDSERYFGTAEENHYSVFRALARNPARFAQLVWVNTVDRTIPMLSIAYGGRAETRQLLPVLSWLLGFLALWGFIELVRRKDWRLLATTVLWPAHLIVYLITISFPVYLQLPFYVVFMLVAVGLTALASNLGNMRERLFALGAMLIIYFASAPADAPTTAVMIGGAALIIATAFLPQLLRQRQPGVVFALAVLGIMAVNLPDKNRLAWPGPENGYEKQAAFLKEHFPPLTPTKAWPALSAVLAKMEWLGIGTEVKNIDSQQDLRKVLKSQNIRVVLVDPYLTTQNIYGWADSIRKYGKGYLKPVWQSEDGKFQALVPSD